MTADGSGVAVPADGGPLVFVADLDVPVLDDGDHHHLAKARRLRPGDELVLADGVGHWRAARFAGTAPEPVGPVHAAPRPRPSLTVAFALVKGTRPELAVQKLTELGIDRIRPFVAARSVVRWDEARSERGRTRLERVAREAAMQSRRADVPVVEPVAPFADVAATPGACLADRSGAPPDLDLPVVLTGPEGGWGRDELASGLPVVGLGPGVLRAETAAITAGALLAALRAGLVLPAGPGRPDRLGRP